ncbi:MAG: diguanylate cyclase [Xanthomonadales bacterium]|nr:diguanylate cyclase [Xanthomonadales bacterium]
MERKTNPWSSVACSVGWSVCIALLLILGPRTVLSQEAEEVARLEESLARLPAPRRIEALNQLVELTRDESPGQAIGYLEQLFPLLEEADHQRALAEALLHAGSLLVSQSNMQKGERYLGRADAIAEEAGIPKVRIDVLLARGVAARLRDEFSAAEALFAQAGEAAEALPDEMRAAKALYELSIIQFFRGQYADALTQVEQAYQRFVTLEDLRGQGKALNIIGILHGSQGRLDESLEAMLQALVISRQTGNVNSEQALLNNIALTFHKLDKWDQALEVYEQALALARQLEDRHSISLALSNMAIAANNLGMAEDALQYNTQALEIAGEIGSESLQIRALNGLSDVSRVQGDYEAALDFTRRALAIAGDSEDRTVAFGPKLDLARIERHFGRYQQAHTAVDEVLRATREQDDRELLSSALREKAEISEAEGDFQSALSHYREHVDIQRELFNEESDRTIAGLRARFEAEQKDSEIARLNYEKRLQELALSEQEALLEKRRTQRNGIVVGLVAIFIIAFLAYQRYTQRRITRELSSLVEQRTADLQEANEELQSAYALVEKKSLTDDLTGLRNRRFAMARIPDDVDFVDQQYRRGETDGTDLLFFLIDLDHFKSVNDTYGHAAGDLVIAQTAELLRKLFREQDYIVRWGGEEFLAVVRFANRAEAPGFAERMRETFATYEFDIGADEPIRRTCSIGFAVYPFFRDDPSRVGWEQVVDVADLCLYAAKKSRRNAWVGLDFEESDDDELLGHLLTDPPRVLKRRRSALKSSLEHEDSLSWH